MSTVAKLQARGQGRNAVNERGVPDLAAAKLIPIESVVDTLQLERHGRMVRCWRPENHAHGDRTPSVGIWRRKNRVKCFVCDVKPLSSIDLVMNVLGMDIFGALLWLDANFGLPRIARGTHLVSRSPRNPHSRVGASGDRLESVVRSGLWGQLSTAEARLLKVLDTLADETGTVTLSYAGLRRFSGLGSDSSVRAGIGGLQRRHAVEVIAGRGGDGFPAANTYKLTLEHEDFLRLLRACHADTYEEIEKERQLRAQIRRHRRLQSSPSSPGSFSALSESTPGGGTAITGNKILYTRCRAENLNATTTGAAKLTKAETTNRRETANDSEVKGRSPNGQSRRSAGRNSLAPTSWNWPHCGSKTRSFRKNTQRTSLPPSEGQTQKGCG